MSCGKVVPGIEFVNALLYYMTMSCSRFFQMVSLIDQDFQSEEMNQIVNSFLDKASYSSKWMLYSDYCLDDVSKPNDVISFALLPFSSAERYKELDVKIKETQPKDIKHSQRISEEYISYIKEQPIFSFSFLVNNRKQFFGDNGAERVDTVLSILNQIKQNFETWVKNPDNEQVKDYYEESINKLNRQIKEISQRKNVKNHIDIILITVLAAHYTANILRDLPELEVFGWFPDRDSTNEACDQIALPIFNVVQYNMLNGKQYLLAGSVPDSTKVPFYDNENRIVDIICGTLADYNQKENLVSKDKFSEVLQSLIADNPFIKIYRLFFDEENTHLGQIFISSTPIKEGE